MYFIVHAAFVRIKLMMIMMMMIASLFHHCCNHLAFCQAWSFNEYVMLCYNTTTAVIIRYY